MADIKPVLQRPNPKLMQTFIQTYPAFTNTATLFPVAVGDLSEITVQAYGSFVGGGSVGIKGSNDPRVVTDPSNAIWFDCTYDGTNAIAFAAAGAKNIWEHPVWIKPAVTGTLASPLLAISGKRMVH